MHVSMLSLSWLAISNVLKVNMIAKVSSDLAKYFEPVNREIAALHRLCTTKVQKELLNLGCMWDDR